MKKIFETFKETLNERRRNKEGGVLGYNKLKIPGLDKKNKRNVVAFKLYGYAVDYSNEPEIIYKHGRNANVIAIEPGSGGDYDGIYSWDRDKYTDKENKTIEKYLDKMGEDYPDWFEEWWINSFDEDDIY